MTRNSTKDRLLAGTLLAGLAIGGLATPAQAQQAQPGSAPAPAPSAAASEEIVITGSRIPRPQYEGSIPGVQVSQDAIESRSFTNAADILNDLPLVGGGANILGNNGNQNASLGVAYIDLLDLGTARTLTLVNGRRFVSGNAGTIFVSGNETGSQVDVNNIPVGLIDRIDVLTVGGAAAYGSDAIAGVVNYVLKDKYEGAEFTTFGGTTRYGDGGSAIFRFLGGRNFFDDRMNLVISGEYSQLDAISADERPFRASNQGGLTNFGNGARRNSAFTPNAAIDVAGLNNGAFLRSTDDGVSTTVFLPGATAVNQAIGGQVFTIATTTLPGPVTAGISSGGVIGGNANGAIAGAFLAGTTQLVPGLPTAGVVGTAIAPNANFAANGQPVGTFAPSALPTGVTAASVFAANNVPASVTGGLTAAQQTTLALNILQSQRLTPREFFAANPTTPVTAFAGTFVAAFPDIANTGASGTVLGRTAVPLRFGQDGSLQTFTLATLQPNTPSTIGAAFGGDGFNAIPFTPLRIEQTREIYNFNGHFDLTDNIRFFTENLYTKVTAATPRNLGGVGNTLASNTTENAALVMSVNNPFLTAANRADLAAVGIGTGTGQTPNFILSRSNTDLLGDNGFSANTDTQRSVFGVKGDFDFAEKPFSWEISYTRGTVDAVVNTAGVRDVEFALAIDAAVNPANGQIVCRSQLNPTAFIGQTLPGVFANVVRLPGADGIGRDQLFTPTPTADMINRCQPLNPFGENRASTAAKEYITARTQLFAGSEQSFWQGVVTGEVLNLPGGPIGFSLSGEYREESLDYRTDELSRLGRTRGASISWTSAETTTTEYGAEVRIPIFGPDFNFFLLRELDITPGARWVQLEGSAPSFRNLAGQLREQKYEGDVEQISTINFNYKPFEDVRFRGNVTRAIRQPSVVELFLSGQPFFTTSADPCSTANISLGPRPATRRANCIADVVSRGAAADATAAAAFLNTFVPSGAAFQGLISGELGLKPETADSWTAGIVVEPRWVEGLQISADYINLQIDDIIGPLLAQPAAEFCYDSPTYPDSTAQIGLNSCTAIQRDTTFNFTNGFVLPFYNLPSTKVRAWSFNFDYKRELGELFRTDTDLGRLRLRGNAYNLMVYSSSASGTFIGDAIRTDGTLARPSWETQLALEWRYKNFDFDWTWNWTDATKIKSAGTPITIETQPILGYEDYSLHDATVSWLLADRVRLQATVTNVFDYTAIGQEGYFLNQYADQLGRRYTFSLKATW